MTRILPKIAKNNFAVFFKKICVKTTGGQAAQAVHLRQRPRPTSHQRREADEVRRRPVRPGGGAVRGVAEEGDPGAGEGDHGRGHLQGFRRQGGS